MPRAVVPSEVDVEQLARELLRAATPSVLERARDTFSVDQRLMRWAIARPAFKTDLFRFVDVYPACESADDVLQHLDEYLDNESTPMTVRRGLHVAHRLPGGAHLARVATKAGITRMARQFIGGTTADDAVTRVRQLWDRGFAATVDLLGEKTLTLADADAYTQRVQAMLEAMTAAATSWPPQPMLESDPWGALPRVNVSVKASALAPLLGPATMRQGVTQAVDRLGPLVEQAAATGATVHIDTEHDELKDATFAVLREVARANGGHAQLGCVVQAYRTDASRDLESLVEWSASTLDRPLQVRLVKGAYWDAETITARAHGWVSPVWREKDATDASYEQCASTLIKHAGEVRPAFASHNARSLAYAIAAARTAELPESAIECQVLYGMATPLHDAVRRRGLRTRVYVPVGDLVPGMSYLVRRLLENTSNESFVRQRYTGGRGVDELVAPPHAATTAVTEHARYATDAVAPLPFSNEPAREIRRPDVRECLAKEIDRAESTLGFDVPIMIDGRERATTCTIRSVDPGRIDRLVCTSASASTEDVDRAVEVARAAAPSWASAGWATRAAVMFRAAAIMRAQRDSLTGLIVFEAGKPVAEADADACEAIDFLEYYGRAALHLADGAPALQAPGERNEYRYQPRGIGVVIAPWNFPLAIPTGMVSAALVTGNAVVFKPAEQTPGTAYRLVHILLDAGVPPAALGFLPGIGEELGPPLVEHPDVSFITFTGSRAVGLEIAQRAAVVQTGQRHVKRVVAEMGGKNAIVVDHDADLDEAIPAIVQSGFGYAGQKCSAAARVIAVDSIYDAVLERLRGAAELAPIGHPRAFDTLVGPLIDADALQRVRQYQAIAAEEGRVIVQRNDVPDGGWYAGPTVVALDDAFSARIARDEIFGPVVAVLRARNFDDAVQIANDTDYALTAGCFSRSPSHVERASRELRAGNVYLNRGITGALVGRQPFGGYGLSGVGSKAGGPDYLKQFVDPRAVTENTMRQGFAPDE
jgi:RHH-type proline utilization regulon transcriptional repressor/proline dehydrogenase/delta 1-pyrroline-5-carboxylate dehydrogenase